MRRPLIRRFALSALIQLGGSALTTSAVGQSSTYAAPQHTTDWPGLASGSNESEAKASLDLGPELERDRSPKWLLDDQRQLDKSLAAHGSQKPGVVDAYVVVAGLDSAPIFGREAREAGTVLGRRYSCLRYTY